MIKINLLPPELQSPKSLGGIPFSKKDVLFVSASAIIFLVSFVFYAITHFIVLPGEQEELRKKQSERASLVKYEKENSSVKSTISSLTSLQKSIDECRSKRIRFSKKLHELANLVTKNNNEHRVWLDNLEITEAKPQKAKTSKRSRRKSKTPAGPKMGLHLWQASAICQSSELAVATGFFRDMQENRFFKGSFLNYKIPTFDSDEEQVGEQVFPTLTFQLSMTMYTLPPLDFFTTKKSKSTKKR